MNATQLGAKGQAIVTAGLFEGFLILVSAIVILNWWRAAHGGLQRNPHLGLRTPATLRNEDSWRAGNRAAARTAPWYLGFLTVEGAALFAAAGQGWRLVVALVGGAGVVVLIGLMIATAVVGSRAASAVDGAPEPFA